MQSLMVWEKLTGVFQSIFDDESISINEETTADDISAWDSLNHVQLILAVEQAFKIKFKHSDISALENVGDLVEKIQEKLNGEGN